MRHNGLEHGRNRREAEDLAIGHSRQRGHLRTTKVLRRWKLLKSKAVVKAGNADNASSESGPQGQVPEGPGNELLLDLV